MQKISSYLYPNRIAVLVNLESSLTEWRIVYQRNLKIYKGLDNTIEFDFKSANQKRVDISNLDIYCVIMDQSNKELDRVRVLSTNLTGIGKVVIPAIVFDDVEPQFLKYSLFREDNGIKTPVYADTDFGVSGLMELIGGAMPTNTSFFELMSFEPANGKYSNVVDLNGAYTFEVDFSFDKLNGSVQLQIADSNSPTATWVTIDQFDVNSSTTTLTKVYEGVPSIHGDSTSLVNWLKLTYIPDANTTGKIDRAVVRV